MKTFKAFEHNKKSTSSIECVYCWDFGKEWSLCVERSFKERRIAWASWKDAIFAKKAIIILCKLLGDKAKRT